MCISARGKEESLRESCERAKEREKKLEKDRIGQEEKKREREREKEKRRERERESLSSSCGLPSQEKEGSIESAPSP